PIRCKSHSSRIAPEFWAVRTYRIALASAAIFATKIARSTYPLSPFSAPFFATSKFFNSVFSVASINFFNRLLVLKLCDSTDKAFQVRVTECCWKLPFSFRLEKKNFFCGVVNGYGIDTHVIALIAPRVLRISFVKAINRLQKPNK